MSQGPILWGGSSSAANSSLATNLQSFLQTGLVGTPPSYPKNYLNPWYFFNRDPTIGIVTTLTATGNRAANTTFWGSSAASLLTYVTSSATYLRPPASGQIAITGAGGAQFVESPMITLDNMDVGATVYLSFDCQSTGTFASGDIKFEVINYNSSGTFVSAITPSITNIPSSTNNVTASFISTGTSGAQYSIRWFSNNAALRTIIIDSLFLGTNINPLTPILLSGTYTPTLTGGTGNLNGGASTPSLSTYLQINKVVFVAGSINFSGGTVGIAGTVEFNLPVATPNFTSMVQGNGTACWSNGSTLTLVGSIAAVSGTQLVQLTATTVTATGGPGCFYSFSYQIQ